MNLLVDTHVVIWYFSNSYELSKQAKEAINEGGNLVFVSAATSWEIAIKRGLGKLKAPNNFEEEMLRHRFDPLNITISHTLAVENLPFHHNNPFDRLLIAQAKMENLSLVTRDKNIMKYDVSTILA
ncbi:MAG: type II toxin-antitoxin system VapC family toxin [Prochloron sp. SP5CPC1]|nr:type II toxin-antitoxin system VapC family toxin [Candidatus Paraprochloron terpiosi SP5CPC1]